MGRVGGAAASTTGPLHQSGSFYGHQSNSTTDPQQPPGRLKSPHKQPRVHGKFAKKAHTDTIPNNTLVLNLQCAEPQNVQKANDKTKADPSTDAQRQSRRFTREQIEQKQLRDNVKSTSKKLTNTKHVFMRRTHHKYQPRVNGQFVKKRTQESQSKSIVAKYHKITSSTPATRSATGSEPVTQAETITTGGRSHSHNQPQPIAEEALGQTDKEAAKSTKYMETRRLSQRSSSSSSCGQVHNNADPAAISSPRNAVVANIVSVKTLRSSSRPRPQRSDPESAKHQQGSSSCHLPKNCVNQSNMDTPPSSSANLATTTVNHPLRRSSRRRRSASSVPLISMTVHQTTDVLMPVRSNTGGPQRSCSRRRILGSKEVAPKQTSLTVEVERNQTMPLKLRVSPHRRSEESDSTASTSSSKENKIILLYCLCQHLLRGQKLDRQLTIALSNSFKQGNAKQFLKGVGQRKAPISKEEKDQLKMSFEKATANRFRMTTRTRQMVDLCRGLEVNPVPVYCYLKTEDKDENTSKRPEPFDYIATNIHPVKFPTKLTEEEFAICCDCTDGCGPQCKCVRASIDAGSTFINGEDIVAHHKTDFFNAAIVCCGPKCRCHARCSNSAARFFKGRFEVFRRQKELGYGLRTLIPVTTGTVVTEFCGEIIPGREYERRLTDDDPDRSIKTIEYSFQLSFREEDDRMRMLLKRILPSSVVKKLKIEETAHIDPSRFGNIGRFISHGDFPNVRPIRMFENDLRPHMARMLLIATQPIRAGDEIFVDYGSRYLGVPKNKCLCGTLGCTLPRRYLKTLTPTEALETVMAHLNAKRLEISEFEEKKFKENLRNMSVDKQEQLNTKFEMLSQRSSVTHKKSSRRGKKAKKNVSKSTSGSTSSSGSSISPTSSSAASSRGSPSSESSTRSTSENTQAKSKKTKISSETATSPANESGSHADTAVLTSELERQTPLVKTPNASISEHHPNRVPSVAKTTVSTPTMTKWKSEVILQEKATADTSSSLIGVKTRRSADAGPVTAKKRRLENVDPMSKKTFENGPTFKIANAPVIPDSSAKNKVTYVGLPVAQRTAPKRKCVEEAAAASSMAQIEDIVAQQSPKKRNIAVKDRATSFSSKTVVEEADVGDGIVRQIFKGTIGFIRRRLPWQ